MPQTEKHNVPFLDAWRHWMRQGNDVMAHLYDYFSHRNRPNKHKTIFRRYGTIRKVRRFNNVT